MSCVCKVCSFSEFIVFPAVSFLDGFIPLSGLAVFPKCILSSCENYRMNNICKIEVFKDCSFYDYNKNWKQCFLSAKIRYRSLLRDL